MSCSHSALVLAAIGVVCLAWPHSAMAIDLSRLYGHVAVKRNSKDYLKPNDEIKLMKYYQERRIHSHYIIDTSRDDWVDWKVESNQKWPWKKNVVNNTYQDFQFFTFRFNFVFLWLQDSFKWTTHVLPIPMDVKYSGNYMKLRSDMDKHQTFMNAQDINEYASVTAPGQFCVVGGWALREDRPLTFKEVMMVTRKYCQTCYCNYQPVCCLEYPPDYDICFTATSFGDVCDFDQGEACHPYEPFKCPGDGACISIQYLCDGAPDCLDGYDEDSRLCTAAKRPPVEETSSFLQSLLASHGPNYLEKLFGSKARDALAPLGGVDKVAITLSESQTIEDFGAALHLMRSDLEHLRSVFMAVENGDLGMLKSLGIKDSELGDVKFFLEKLVNTGFLD